MTYEPLKRHVARIGGFRLAFHESARDRLVEMAVEEWPTGCDPAHVEEVLRARLRVRVRREYGSALATILIGILVNAIVKIVVEWWFSRISHRVLMEGWHKNAVEAARVQAQKETG
jgi:hypothetical protein